MAKAKGPVRSARRGEYQGRHGWWIALAYRPATVDPLKAAIPWTDRYWDNEAGEWWIADQWASRFAELFPQFGAYLVSSEIEP